MEVQELIKLLSSYRFFSITNEKILQDDIFKVLPSGFIKEHRLSSRSIIDFYHPETKIGIEVKIKGSPLSIYRQLERYCGYDEIDKIILVTSKTFGLPDKINNKESYLFSLSVALL